MSEILTSDNNGLKIFEDGIKINYKLPKWVNAEQRIKARKESKECKCVEEYYSVYGSFPQTQNIMDSNGTTTSVRIMTTPTGGNGSSDEKLDIVMFDKVASANLKELTEIIKENSSVMHALNGYFQNNSFVTFGSSNLSADSGEKGKKLTLFGRIRNWLTKYEEKKGVEFDAVEFFTQVKMSSKQSATLYRDRVANYLKALHNANSIGQNALVEQLLKEMVANKYENLLDAEGFYYAVTEDQVVKFLKKTEKGIMLSYISNFGRPIPEAVNETIIKVNNLEVFDNYVVLYFDPKGEVFKETEHEKYKRKDPILFGVIAGSKKLYYITDWIDDYCDLTLEKFVDTLKIDKENLRMIKEDKKEVKKEVKKEAKKEVEKEEEEKPQKTANKTKKTKKDE